MDRNSIIGLLIIAGILVGYSLLNQPSEEELRQKRQEAEKELAEKQETSSEGAKEGASSKPEDTPDQGAASNEQKEEAGPEIEESEGSVIKDTSKTKEAQDPALKSDYGIFAPGVKDREKRYYTLENERIKVKVSNKGGRIVSVELKNFTSYDSSALMLFSEDSSNYSLRFKYKGQNFINTKDLYFKAMDSSFVVEGDEKATIRFRTITSDPEKYVELVYELGGDRYTLDHQVRVVGLGQDVGRDVELNWQYKNLSTEKDMPSQRRISTVCYKYKGGDQSYLTQSGNGSEELTAKVDWISFKQHFFSSIITSERGFDDFQSNIMVEDLNSSQYVSKFETNLNIPFASTSSGTFPMTFFFGPNKHNLLASFDKGYEETMNLGWGIIGWINELLIIPIFNLLDDTTMNYGIIILILTLIIKTLLFPLTYKSFLSGAKMRVIKPEIDEIQKKYKGSSDQMKMQQETMALYKKSGVNPMAGCLPMFIQLPILIAMYKFFPTSIELRQEPFLWAEDLSSYDSVLELGFNIPFYGDHVSLFTLLMFVSAIIYSKLSSTQMGGGNSAMPQMKIMTYFFPIIILFVFNSFPAGLSYYYFSANVISIAQMLVIKNFIIDEEALKKKIHENRKNPKKAKKKSKFQKRLEDMAKQRGYDQPK